MTPLSISRWDGASSSASHVVKNMPEEDEPKHEPGGGTKQDGKGTSRNGGYTIPVQMF